LIHPEDAEKLLVKAGEWVSGRGLTFSLSFLSSPFLRSKAVKFGADIGELNSPGGQATPSRESGNGAKTV
jgi:hypothetical protein